MARYMRKRLITAKAESPYGTDAAPTAAANSILVSEITAAFEPNNVDRALIRPYFGNSEQLVGTRSVTLSFTVELVGSGAAGGAPAWAALLEACGLDGTTDNSVSETATTFSAQASDNSFNDSGAGFVTAGFAVGMAVNVTGFTGTVANNIVGGIITALTSGKMTIGGTDGDVIADEAAGDSVTIAAVPRHDFVPITDSVPSVTIHYYKDGSLRKALGCRGTAVLRLNSGEMPAIAFTFRGLDGGLTAAALPNDSDFSDFLTPRIPTDANTQDLVLGGTLAATGAVAFTGGSAIPSLGLEVDLGGATPLVPLIGDESVDLTARALTATVRLSLSAAQEVTRQQAVLDSTLSSIGIVHGTQAGRRVALYLPTAQFTNPTEEDFNGRALMRYELRGVPTPGGTGNDEFRLVTSF
jgi:hypothetical protein